MKKLYSLFFIVFSILVFAQMDREHFFPAMCDRTNTAQQHQTLYLSTDEAQAFPVEIWSGGTLFSTVQISKGNPKKVVIPREKIITKSQEDVFKPVNMGLHVKAQKLFFANLRFSTFNHAEIINSKGTSALGQKFRLGMAPITVQNGILSFMAGVYATEDNTQVTITQINPSVIFSDGQTHNAITFTLNKGQSYIIDGLGSNYPGNKDGLIGAQLTANKPVAVVNGNFNGQYAGALATASDILMDQSIPEDRLGKEFAVIKGNGPIGSNMEKALIIATQDNTQIFVNNETVPLATLNAGGYFLVPEEKFVLQGGEHYNMFIRTTKECYVYQLLAGNSEIHTPATGGFNLLPPLNCYLPRNIDEIGYINENFVHSNNNPSGILNIPTNLNIVTETGATVTINGNPPPAGSGPYTLPGNPLWQTYTVKNVSGNISVNSTKSVTAGIIAGSDAVGYGGYFAGFPKQPEIYISSGSCVPGITLSATITDFDQYQWLRNGTPIPNATQPVYTPVQSGNYSVRVKNGSCSAIVSNIIPVLNCPTTSVQDHTICAETDLAVSMQNSSQNIAPQSFTLITPPQHGTTVYNAQNNTIHYTPENQYSGTDSFVYSVCGADPDFPDCETITVQLQVENISVQNTILHACAGSEGTGIFNLTQAQITANTAYTKTFYKTLSGAQTENPADKIPTSQAYSSTAGTVYAVVKGPHGCKKIAEIQLSLYPYPDFIPYNGMHCDDNLDGSVSVQIASLPPLLATNHAYFQVKFYKTQDEAQTQNGTPVTGTFTYTQNTTLYAVFISPDGCPPVVKPVPLVFGNSIVPLKKTLTDIICDDNLDGIVTVDLSSYNPQWTGDPAVQVRYFATLSDAQNNTNALPQLYTPSSESHLYVRLEKQGFCPGLAELFLSVRKSKKSETLKDITVCPGKEILVDAGPGFEAYLWSNGDTGQTTYVSEGNYWVGLTYNGCTYRQNFTVTVTPPPVILEIKVDKDGTVTVLAHSEYPPLEYSLDGNLWQSSPVFPKLTSGDYTIYVRAADRCEIVKQELTVLQLTNVITPNDDGYNDTIDFSLLMTKNNPKMEIYDRYYAKVFEGNSQNGFKWNGKLGSKNVHTETYWAIVEFTDPLRNTRYSYAFWILVKNRD